MICTDGAPVVICDPDGRQQKITTTWPRVPGQICFFKVFTAFGGRIGARCQVIHWNRDCGDLHLGFARVAPLKAAAHVFRPASLQSTGQSLSAQGGRLAEIRRYKPKPLPVRVLVGGPLPGELIKKANLNSWLGILKTLAADHLQA